MSDVRERHMSVYQKYNDTTICTLCRFPWPCDAIQMADERDAARADADRLAAALERVAEEGQAPTYVLEALRQHEEATR